MKKCPYCAEEIQDEAIFCRYCHNDIKIVPVQQPVHQIQMPAAVYVITKRCQYGKPSQVRTAMTLLYISFGLAGFNSIFVLGTSKVSATTNDLQSNSIFIITVVLIFYAFEWFLFSNIGKGKNWARITNLVLFVIGTGCSAMTGFTSLTTNPVTSILNLGQMVLQAIAVIFLFQKPSNDWFIEMGANK